VKEYIWAALTSLASAPVEERTITGLTVLLQSSALKQALRPYCVGGAHGRLLDAEHEHLGSATVQAFETEGLVGTKDAPAVLSYLFHRIEARFDGRPSLKKNVSVIFSSQSLADIEASPIAPVLVESCPTRIFLANERAIEPQITAVYERFGLNARQIEIIARATPKRDYYCQSRRGNRLFELGLGAVALALCASSDKAAHTLIDELLRDGARPYFLEAWLYANDLAWAADLVPNLTNVIDLSATADQPVPVEPSEQET
jgi:type IV secretion system protein VirB4